MGKALPPPPLGHMPEASTYKYLELSSAELFLHLVLVFLGGKAAIIVNS